MYDSGCIRAQFESSLKFIDWAVKKCAEHADAGLMKSMHRALVEQVKFLERRMREPERPALPTLKGQGTAPGA